MSYIVCSNAESEDNINVGGFSNPATFTNHFKSPLIIQPDSEVAVESVKIDRADEWSIKETDNFFIYYGPEQSDGNDPFINSGRTTKNGVRIDVAPGSYNKDQFVNALKRAVNRAPLGPLLFNNCNVVDVVDETTGKFKGFTFSFTSRGNGVNMVGEGAGDDVLTADMFVDANGEAIRYRSDPGLGAGTGAYTYTDGNQRITCNVSQAAPLYYGGDSVARMLAPATKIHHPKGPIVPINGELIVNFAGVTNGDWCVGLSRPNSPYWRSGFPSIFNAPPNATYGNSNAADRPRMCMYDFWVQYRRANGGSLRVYTWGFTPGANNWQVKKLNYQDANNTGGDYDAEIDTAKIAADNLVAVKFLFDGNKIKVKLIDNGAVETDLIGTNSKKLYNYAPLQNSTEALVPIFQMNQEDDFLTLEHLTIYSDSQMTKWKYPSATNFDLDANYLPIMGGTIVPGSDWYSNAEVRNNAGGELRYNQLRPSVVWRNLDGSGPTGEVYYYSETGGNTYIPDYVPVMIVGEEDRVAGVDDFSQVLYIIPDPQRALPNMGKNLGFGTFPVVLHSQFGGTDDLENLTTLNSIEAGEFTVHSAFIRINDLPVQTFNGATSSRSNIVYHIPRFSQDGRSFGELFFQSHEKTYLALNNTDRIMLSQLSIDIVGRNERIVEDLQGSTIVALHIRPRRK